MVGPSLEIIRKWSTLSNLITVAFIFYAGTTLTKLSALGSTGDADLFRSDGSLKPLVFPLWALAPRGLTLTVALTALPKRQGAREDRVELFSSHGLAFGGDGFDFALRVELLRREGGDEFAGLRVVCEPDAAGDIAPHCLALAALRESREGVAAALPSPSRDAGSALVDAAVGAGALLRRGVIPSAVNTLSRVFGFAPQTKNGFVPLVLCHEVSPVAARVARGIASGHKVVLDAVIGWTSRDAEAATVDEAGAVAAAAARKELVSPLPMTTATPQATVTSAFSHVTRTLKWAVGIDVDKATAAARATSNALRAAHADIDEVPQDLRTLTSRVVLIDPLAFAPLRVRRYLWRDVLGEEHTALPGALGLKMNLPQPLEGVTNTGASTTLASSAAGSLVPHWLGQVDLRLLSDPRAFPRDELPAAVAGVLRVVGWPVAKAKALVSASSAAAEVNVDARRRALAPAFIANPVRPTRDAAVPVNITTASVPLRLTMAPMTVGTWRLMRTMDSSISSQHAMGATERDTDDVIRLLSDTPAWLLGLTFAVAFVHILFDVLALKNDVAFWASAQSLRGISVRSLGAQCASNVIITAFLYREGSSLLVTGPQAALAALDAWKMSRAAGAAFAWPKGGWGLPSVRWDNEFAASAAGGEAGQHDAEAVGTMVVLSVPLLMGAAARSLLYDTHASWTDWVLGVAVGAVYTFGFALMTPQLWINYRLKSVAHLPWSVLGYRFINTIIDDVFAAVVKMPLLHRVSVFRDDVIFVIYMVQRRVYEVDRSRPAEGFEIDGGGGGGA